MPGVPSGRGCEACRKQKKKCDQTRPACSRCSRLKIPCIGAGERRFKFKDQTLAVRSSKHVRKPTDKREIAAIPNPSSDQPEVALLLVPYNDTMRIAGALISTLAISDLRYAVSYYGGFLERVPQRLGINQALDASVLALASASTCFRTRENSTQVLVQYGNALKALRLSLNDPRKAESPETLCAIYLVMICQGWIGLRDDQMVRHGPIMAQIMNAAAQKQGQDSFFGELAFALSLPVIFESMVNPNVRLTAHLLKHAETYGPPRPLVNKKEDDPIGLRLDTLSLSSLAKMPDFIRHPERHWFDMQLTYEQKRIDIKRMRDRLPDVSELPAATQVGRFSPPLSPRTLIYLYYAAYAMLLGMALIINGLLRALDPLDITLVEDAIVFTDELVVIAENMSKYRPLGAGFIPLCLLAGWAVTSDPEKQSRIQEMVLDYQTDFAGVRWMAAGFWLKDRYDSLRLNTMATQLEKQQRTSYPGV